MTPAYSFSDDFKLLEEESKKPGNIPKILNKQSRENNQTT